METKLKTTGFNIEEYNMMINEGETVNIINRLLQPCTILNEGVYTWDSCKEIVYKNDVTGECYLVDANGKFKRHGELESNEDLLIAINITPSFSTEIITKIDFIEEKLKTGEIKEFTIQYNDGYIDIKMDSVNYKVHRVGLTLPQSEKIIGIIHDYFND